MSQIDIRYMKILYAIAWSDDRLEPKEIALLKDLASTVKFTAEQVKNQEEWNTSPVHIRDLCEGDVTGFSLEQRQHLLFLAMTVARADGTVAPSEKQDIRLLRDLLGLTDIEYKDLVEEIEAANKLYGGSISTSWR